MNNYYCKMAMPLLLIVLMSFSFSVIGSPKNDSDKNGDRKVYCRCENGKCIAGYENDIRPLCKEGHNVNCRTHDANCDGVLEPITGGGL